MNKFKIKVEEILRREIEIEANNLDEAIDIVSERYRMSEIVLDSEDFVECTIEECGQNHLEKVIKENIVKINTGYALLLKESQDYMLLKRIEKNEFEPFIIVRGLKYNENKKYFEWRNGIYFQNLEEATSEYNKLTKKELYNENTEIKTNRQLTNQEDLEI